MKPALKTMYQEIKSGDIILTAPKDSGNPFLKILAFLIQAVTRGKSTHAILVEDNKHCIEAIFPEISRRTIKRYFNGTHDLFIFRKTDLSEEQLSRVMISARGRIGRDYDMAGLFGFVFKNKNNENDNFCSELVVECYAEAGINLTETIAGTTSPADLRRFLSKDDSKVNKWIQVYGKEIWEK